MKYQAFISYKHTEHSRKYALALENALKKYAKPLLKPPIKIFRDEQEMRPGDDLAATIKDALYHSEYLIYLASQEAAESLWVRDELRIWCEQLKKVNNLIIIYIDDEIVFDLNEKIINWDYTNALPRLLQHHIASIPLYIDLRWAETDADLDLNNIRYKEIINSITARFRGKTPNEMNGEEVLIYRRNKRLRNIAIVLLTLLTLIASGTAWYAFEQRNSARQERDIARANLLSLYATQEVSHDPTTSFRLAEAVLRQFGSKPEAVSVIFQTFYQTQTYPFYEQWDQVDTLTTGAIAPSSEYVAVASGTRLTMYASDGAMLSQQEYPHAIVEVKISPDAELIAIRDQQGNITLCDKEGNVLKSLPYSDIDALQFSPQTAYLLCRKNSWPSFQIFVYHLQQQTTQEIQYEGVPNSQMLYGDVVRFAPDDSALLLCLHDEVCTLYDLKRNSEVQIESEDLPIAAAFSENARWLLLATQRGLERYDLTTKERVNSRDEGYLVNPVTTLEYLPGKETFLVGYTNGLLKIVDQELRDVRIMMSDPSGIQAIRLFSDEHKVASISNNHTIWLWDLDGNALQQWRGHTGRILDLSYVENTAPYGVSLGLNRTAKKWNLSGKSYWTFQENASTPDQFPPFFSSASDKVVAPGGEETIKVFTLQGKLLYELPKPDGFWGIADDSWPEARFQELNTSYPPLSHPQNSLYPLDAPELSALPGYAHVRAIWQDIRSDLFSEDFSPTEYRVRISPDQKYLLICRLGLVRNSYWGDFVVFPVDVQEILRLVNQERIFGKVWQLDASAREHYGVQ